MNNKIKSNISIPHAISKTIAIISKLFGQWGLGTIYAQFEKIKYFKNKKCLITKFEDVYLEINVFDSYWAPYLIGDRQYEKDVSNLLERLASLDAVFIDCGANIGYWSAIVSSTKFKWKPIIAIEANPKTFKKLQRNAELNNNRFICHSAAIFNKSGLDVFIEDADIHAIAHIGHQGISVTTVTIDEVIENNEILKNKVIIIKLDVEGAEISAIEGSQITQKLEHVFIYEDWMENEFPVTYYLLEKGYYIYGISKNGKCVLLKSVEDAKKFQLKNFKKQGIKHKYGPLNNVACKEGKVFDLMKKWTNDYSI